MQTKQLENSFDWAPFDSSENCAQEFVAAPKDDANKMKARSSRTRRLA